MQRTLIVAALSVLAAGSALAQETTIYGRINTSIERIKVDGVTSTEMLNNASRIGFKGGEDLGGGLKAGFQLEHGFDSTYGGADDLFWGRQSEVNLSGNFGMLRLGRFTSEAYFATADYVSLHNHDTGTSADWLYAYIARDSNKIAYRSPDLGGVTVEGAMSLKESGTDNAYDLAANYAAGPLALGAGFQKEGSANQFAVRALYEMGPFVFGGYVQREKNVYDAAGGSRTLFRLSGMYTMGASEFHANVGRSGDYGNIDNSAATQFTLAYNYNLSKRTKVYAYYTKIDAEAASFVPDLSSLALGIRHNF
jgi:predicted porin